jgi:uncharacterized membrane protein YjjB (DUF3815 family)
MARRFAWIWLVGCIAWVFNALVSIHVHSPQHAQLAAIMAVLFGIAWLFYRGQQPR